jgi:hypothetical protein
MWNNPVKPCKSLISQQLVSCQQELSHEDSWKYGHNGDYQCCCSTNLIMCQHKLQCSLNVIFNKKNVSKTYLFMLLLFKVNLLSHNLKVHVYLWQVKWSWELKNSLISYRKQNDCGSSEKNFFNWELSHQGQIQIYSAIKEPVSECEILTNLISMHQIKTDMLQKLWILQ